MEVAGVSVIHGKIWAFVQYIKKKGGGELGIMNYEL
jgi:hypothetical protein